MEWKWKRASESRSAVAATHRQQKCLLHSRRVVPIERSLRGPGQSQVGRRLRPLQVRRCPRRRNRPCLTARSLDSPRFALLVSARRVELELLTALVPQQKCPFLRFPSPCLWSPTRPRLTPSPRPYCSTVLIKHRARTSRPSAGPTTTLKRVIRRAEKAEQVSRRSVFLAPRSHAAGLVSNRRTRHTRVQDWKSLQGQTTRAPDNKILV